MRAGPQLRVDAFSISNYGSAMFAQVQPQHSPLMLLTPTASAASLGHERLLAVVRDSRFARYCEENTLANAFILTNTTTIPEIYNHLSRYTFHIYGFLSNHIQLQESR